MNTRVYLVDCSLLEQPAQRQRTYPLLDAARQGQVERHQTAAGKSQRAAAGALLTHLLGADGKPPLLSHGSRGKPYLAGREDLFFNLTHCGRFVLCAVSEGEVGVDAQWQEPCRPSVVGRCFTEAERAWMDQDPDERFTRLWTRKEAYVKFTGFGLVLPLSSFSVPTDTLGWDEDQHCQWAEQKTQDGEKSLWVTVCTASPAPIEPLIPLDVDDLLKLYGL